MLINVNAPAYSVHAPEESLAVTKKVIVSYDKRTAMDRVVCGGGEHVNPPGRVRLSEKI